MTRVNWVIREAHGRDLRPHPVGRESWAGSVSLQLALNPQQVYVAQDGVAEGLEPYFLLTTQVCHVLAVFLGCGEVSMSKGNW